ncbi:alkaline phosphatase family protein [Streptomyces sp. NPDC054887]
MTVYWVVWDAGAHWVVDRLEREGALPSVSRMRRRGTFASARPAHPNCQTPPSLATLFTGTWPSEHRVTGYTVPGAGEGLASHVSGFAPGFPAAEPVWETLSEHDLTSALVHVPWVFDHEDRVGPHIDGAVEAYSRRSTRHGVQVVEAGTGRQDWQIGAFRTEVEVGDDQVRVGVGADGVLLVPGGDWRPLRLDAEQGTWVRCVPVGGRLLLVHTGVWRPRVAGRNRGSLRRLTECPPFAGEGVGPLYRKGVFGPRLAEGGDGGAEEVFLSSVRCVARSFAAATDAVLETHDADLVVVYLPMTDDVGHELLGWCDERSGAYRADIAETVWSYVRRCYEWSDAVLGRVLDRAGAEDTVVLGADHGMVGSTHLVHLNDALVRAGLARTRPGGELDAERSEVFYHPANNGSLWAGPAAAGDPVRARTAMARAFAALSALTDPDTGRPVVSGFLDRDGLHPADLDADPTLAYVALTDDYQPTAELLGEGAVVRRVPKTGAHVVYTGDSRLHAVHAALGPGIEAGQEAGVIDNTWPAALVLGRLGVDRDTAGPYAGTSDSTDES